MPYADVIIVGSGIAALMTAYCLHEDKNVMIFTKSKKERSNSWLAQGGVAAVVSKEDNWRCHYKDTMIAGCHHNDEKAVKILVQEGPKQIQELINRGFRFDTDARGRLQLGKEGAHQLRRILHAGGDATGRKMVSFLLKQLINKVTIVEEEMVSELLIKNGRCVGIKTKKKTGEVACTGVHGANRLASNSLLEGIVFGKRLAETLRKGVQENILVETCKHTENHFMKKITKILPSKQQIQTQMKQYVGIVRNESGLKKAKQWFEQFSIPDLLNADLDELTTEEITIINMIITGWMITTSALKRTESRGGHYRTDYPSMDENWKGKRIVRTKEELFVNV
jgi:aspartate oxidase